MFMNMRCLKGVIKVGLPDGTAKEVKEFGDIKISNDIILKMCFL